jgi:succinate-semialdehyde dehydrogenase/glutarate-semialdehyde dehydrogenase
MHFTTINPYNQEILENYKTISDEDVEKLIQHSNDTFLRFKYKKPSSRKEKMLKLAEILKTNTLKYAKQITLEMGKPVTQSVAEIEKCAWVCEHYAQNAEDLLKTEEISTEASSSIVEKKPLGVIFGIMPWNYPFWQVFRVLAPNIMLGNTLIIKHSPNTLGCAEMIGEAIQEAGFAPNTYTHIIIKIKQVEAVIANDLVKGVTFTGSAEAGSSVAGLAGKYLKKSVLELGGNNALVVFPDADIEKTVDTCIKARFQNTGQSCIAGKRLLLNESIYDEFIEKIKSKINALKTGDPNDNETYISVMAREDLAEHLKGLLEESIKSGASIIAGGQTEKCYFEPTLVEGVTNTMPLFKEETFGPLLAVTKFTTDKEAIKLINDSPYGLGASLFTNDDEKFNQLSKQIDDGAVFLNELVKSHPKLPFGGTKKSGYGRELGEQGILEFANIKTIYKN